MNDAKFSRELKNLIYYVREYGVRHISFPLSDPAKVAEDAEKMDEFYIQVHRGFFTAQERVCVLLKKVLLEKRKTKAALAEARRQRNKEEENRTIKALNKLKLQEHVLRKVMDTVAWQIFQGDLTVMRRLYCGQELIDISDSNLDSELRFLEQFRKDDPGGFVLISDLTSFVQIGDVVTVSKRNGICIAELKEGEVNCEIFAILDNVSKTQCPRALQLALQGKNKNFVKHFDRTVKQLEKSYQTYETLSTGQGTDLLTGQKVHIIQDEVELESFSGLVSALAKDCHKKGFAISAVEECLLIGVYDTSKFPGWAFEMWAKSLGIKMPIYDMRTSFFDPLSYPLFLHDFPDSFIVDLVLGKKVIYMTVDVEKWLETFKEAGCTVRWLSKKETARTNSRLNGANRIFDMDGQGIQISKNGASLEIGPGIFSRMFTGFTNPSSITKLLLATLAHAQECEEAAP